MLNTVQGNSGRIVNWTHCISFMDLFPCISGREDKRNKERGKEAKVVAVCTESEGRKH